jgi:hypothetical protein
LISAVAIAGRGMVLTLVTHLGTTDARWSRWAAAAALLALMVVIIGQAVTMARSGPISRLRVPAGWSAASGAASPSSAVVAVDG